MRVVKSGVQKYSAWIYPFPNYQHYPIPVFITEMFL